MMKNQLNNNKINLVKMDNRCIIILKTVKMVKKIKNKDIKEMMMIIEEMMKIIKMILNNINKSNNKEIEMEHMFKIQNQNNNKMIYFMLKRNQ